MPQLTSPRWSTFVFLAAFVGVMAFSATQLPAIAASIDLSTGLNSSGTLIGSGGVADANWTVQELSGPDAAAQTVFPGDADWFSGGDGLSAWAANGPNSDWIARDPTNQSQGRGPYNFYETFDLSGYILSTVSLSGASRRTTAPRYI